MNVVYLPIGPGSGVMIDWGDGSPLEHYTGDGSENYLSLMTSNLEALNFEDLHPDTISNMTVSELDALFLIGDIPKHVYSDMYMESSGYNVKVYGTVSYYHCQAVSLPALRNAKYLSALETNITNAITNNSEVVIPDNSDMHNVLTPATVEVIDSFKSDLNLKSYASLYKHSILHNGLNTSFGLDVAQQLTPGVTWEGFCVNSIPYHNEIVGDMTEKVETYCDYLNREPGELNLRDAIMAYPFISDMYPTYEPDYGPVLDFSSLNLVKNDTVVMNIHHLRDYFVKYPETVNRVRQDLFYPLKDKVTSDNLGDVLEELDGYLSLPCTVYNLKYPEVMSHAHFNEQLAISLPELLEYSVTRPRVTSLSAQSGNSYDINPDRVTTETSFTASPYGYISDWVLRYRWLRKGFTQLGYDSVKYKSDTSFSFGVEFDTTVIDHSIDPYDDWDTSIGTTRVLCVGIDPSIAIKSIVDVNYLMSGDVPSTGLVVVYNFTPIGTNARILAFGDSAANDSNPLVNSIMPGVYASGIFEILPSSPSYSKRAMIDYDAVNKKVTFSVISDVDSPTLSIEAEVEDVLDNVGVVTGNLTLHHVALTENNEVYNHSGKTRVDNQGFTIYKDAVIPFISPAYTPLRDVVHESLVCNETEALDVPIQNTYFLDNSKVGQYGFANYTIYGNVINTLAGINNITYLNSNITSGNKYQLEYNVTLDLTDVITGSGTACHVFEFDGSNDNSNNGGSTVEVRVQKVVYVDDATNEDTHYLRLHLLNYLKDGREIGKVFEEGYIEDAYIDINLTTAVQNPVIDLRFNVLVEYDTGYTEVVTTAPGNQMFTVNNLIDKNKTNVDSLTAGPNQDSVGSSFNFVLKHTCTGTVTAVSVLEVRDSSLFQNTNPQYTGDIDISTGLVNTIDVCYN